MQPFLDHQRQFTTQESNKSRCVTKIRWIVATVNRRIKEFKYFANTIQNSSLMYLQDDLSIACALINCYRPPIAASNPQGIELGREMRSLITKKNRLEKVKIITSSMKRSFLCFSYWKTITCWSVPQHGKPLITPMSSIISRCCPRKSLVISLWVGNIWWEQSCVYECFF